MCVGSSNRNYWMIRFPNRCVRTRNRRRVHHRDRRRIRLRKTLREVPVVTAVKNWKTKEQKRAVESADVRV
jgi:hypothetical protein